MPPTPACSTRRDVLRLISLSALAVAAAPVVTACGRGGTETSGPAPVVVGDIETVASDVRRSSGVDADVAPVVASMHLTGAAILAAVGEAGGNVTVSPYSLAVALGLTANGARGRTLDQLREGVFGGLELDRVNGGLNALDGDLTAQAGRQERRDATTVELALATANGLFGQQGLAWRTEFLDLLARDYGAAMQGVDWAGATSSARAAVNSWVAERTEDLIPELLPADAVGPDTRLVLVNTLYVKAPWETPFERTLTEPGDFTRADGSTVRTPLMRSSGTMPCGYAAGPGWAVAQLAYAGRGLAMTVLLPDAGRFDEVAADVADGGWAPYLDRVRPDSVDVTLPSWSTRTTASLAEPLAAMGIEDLFAPGVCDLSGVTDEEDLVVSHVLQQVVVSVDEGGTEAAAATAVVAVRLSGQLDPTTFVADRPFLYLIHDVEHGTPLFAGRIVDPTQT